MMDYYLGRYLPAKYFNPMYFVSRLLCQSRQTRAPEWNFYR
jgi:hypothetical protein